MITKLNEFHFHVDLASQNSVIMHNSSSNVVNQEQNSHGGHHGMVTPSSGVINAAINNCVSPSNSGVSSRYV